ncbi:hypothetical protein CCH79_00004934 [Gambusia affinis]|uniref:Transmembrane 6 superfamily member 1 n=1 Tax=Gambusia affinis TaxID=33528 RepID=A0A315V6V4_GAMAF|nr:hypothetical protein CCH79_00004934 [Gambusia affinis]
MSASAGTGVFMLSLMSIPFCYLFNSFIYSNSAEAFFAGCTAVLILTISVRFMLKKKAPVDPLFYVLAFLSVVNLIIGLEQDNIIDGFVTFYLKECVSVHVVPAVIIAVLYGLRRDSYRAIGLYWVGSFLMRTMVYILGNAVGKYGSQVTPLFVLHMLYITVSVWACSRILSQPSTHDAQLTSIQESQGTNLLHRPLDLLFIVYLFPALAFCVFRGLVRNCERINKYKSWTDEMIHQWPVFVLEVVLDCPSKWCEDYTQQFEPYLKDPSAYPKVQMLVSMLYSGPYYIITLYGLLVPGCEWVPDLTLVHSGALAQAQFSHIGASLHTRTPFSYRVPADSQPVFLLVNVLYALVPHALCYRCCTQPAFFIKPRGEKKTQ